MTNQPDHIEALIDAQRVHMRRITTLCVLAFAGACWLMSLSDPVARMCVGVATMALWLGGCLFTVIAYQQKLRAHDFGRPDWKGRA